MIYAYIRVGTDKQSVENQRFEILKYADAKKLTVDRWVEETASGRKRLGERMLGVTLGHLGENDILIVSELSRLGRNLMEVMSILHTCMEKDVKVHTIREKHELGDNTSSKVLAFAFSLSAEIERQLISQRTKEALARKKSEGMKLGRPKGSLSSYTKLTGKGEQIKELLSKRISYTAVGRILGVHRKTVKSFVESRQLRSNPD